MKKFVSVLLAVLLVIGAAPVQTFAAPAAEPSAAEAAQPAAETETTVSPRLTTGEWLTVSGIEGGKIKFDSSTGTITDCYSVVTKADIPSTINGVRVTSIGYEAFFDCDSLTSVTIPDSVTSIGDRAFRWCDSLTSITIPASVTSIGDLAFSGCDGLTSITIPASVTSIGESVFSGCDGLTSITVVEGNPSYESRDGVLFNKSLTELLRCPARKTGAYAIPGTVTSISEGAFSGCSSLTSITIPNSVTSIESSTFRDCRSLTSIDIPDSLTSIGEYAFDGCASLLSITIPNSVTSIASYAFEGCSGLTSITIPDSVTSIGWRAFAECRSLTSITVAEGNQSYASKDGVLYNKNLTELLQCPGGKAGTFTVPDSVTSIGDSAFAWCDSLTGVIIPDGVTSIEEMAFSYCTSLTSITIPDGVTSITYGVFMGCDRLIGITIPDSVTSIGDYAFDDCTSLKDVYYNGSQEQWKKISIVYFDPFYGSMNTPLKKAVIHYNSTAEDMYIDLAGVSVPAGKYRFHITDQNGKALQGAKVTYDKQSDTTDKYGLVTFDSFTAGTPKVTVTLDGYETWTNENSSWQKNESGFETIYLYPEGMGKYKLAECRYSNSATFSDINTNLLTSIKKVALKNSDVFDLDYGNFYVSCKSCSPDETEQYQLWQGKTMVAESANGQFSLSVEQFSAGSGCKIRVVTKDGKKIDTPINLEFVEIKINKDSSLKLGEGFSVSISDEVPFLGGGEVSVDFPALPIDIEATSSKLHIGLNLNLFDSEEDKTEKEKETRWENMKKSFANAKRAGKQELSKANADALKKLVKEDKDFALPATGKVKVNVVGYAEADWGSSTAKGEIFLIVNASTRTFGFNTMVVVVPVTVQVKATASVQAGAEIAYNWEINTLTGGLDLNVSVNLNAFAGPGVGDVVGIGVYGDATVDMDSRLWGTNPGVERVDLTGELGIKAYVGILSYNKPFAYHTWNLYTANNVNALSLNSAAGETDDGGSMFDAASYKPQDLSYLAEESAWNGGTALRRMALRSAQAKTELKSLLTDTYRNSQPTMISTASGLYAAFLRADQTSETVYAVVTKYNGSTWAEPVRVDNAAVLDNAPSLCEDADGNIWLAYAKTALDYDKNRLSDYAQKQSIVVGTIDPSTLAFTKVNEYIGMGYAHLQQLAMVNGVPTLAWVDSDVTDDNSVLWTQNNTVKVAQCTGGTWGAAQTLTTEPKCVSQIALGEQNGALAVAYTVDKDNDYNTTEDQDLYCWTNSTASLLAENVQGAVQFAKLPGQAQADFLWNQDGTLKTAGGVTVEAAGITGEYAVTSDRIYYSAAGETGAQLTTVCYESGAWSAPVTITGGERYLENLSAATWNGNDFVLGMNTLATITEQEVQDAKDLVWAAIQPVSDLKLEEITYEAEGLTAGKETPVTLWVTNAGDHEVTSIDITHNGSTLTEACQLQPGETEQFAMSLTCPATLTEYSFTVNETGKEDYTPADNTAAVSLGYADVAVELSEQRIGTDWSLVAVVTNNGVAPASGGISFTNADGESVGESYFENVEPGATVVATKKISKPGDYTASLSCEGDDLYTYNNSETINVQRSTEIQLVEQQEDGIHATIYAEQPATAYCAIYSDSGKMLGIQQAALTAGIQENVFALNNPAATRVKVFLLDENQKPLAEAKEIEG